MYESIKVSIWDIGGQKELRKYWDNYFGDVDGLVTYYIYILKDFCYRFLR